MSTPNPAEVIAGHLYRGQDHSTVWDRAYCWCGWSEHIAGTHKQAVALHAEHVVSMLSAGGFEIVPAGTSAAMGAFAAGSVTKQRVLEDIAYALTGWRYEEPEDTWAAVAQVARGLGNSALVSDVEKSYAENLEQSQTPDARRGRPRLDFDAADKDTPYNENRALQISEAGEFWPFISLEPGYAKLLAAHLLAAVRAAGGES